MKSKSLTDRQLFELELEQLKSIELIENEEMWTQRVIDESALTSENSKLIASNDGSENL
jgi:hypothetical protein